MIVYFLELGNFGIPVFGLLIAVSVLGGLVVMRKFLLSSVDVKIAENVAITSVLLGFLGAKIWYEIFVAENFFRDFDIREGISGIVFHGGFITGSLAFVLISKFYRLPLLCMLDAGSLALLFGFGVGRLACQISGDGDYGLPTDSFIGMAYKSGVIPIWEPVYPTPIFESLTALAGFLFLSAKMGASKVGTGKIFAAALVLLGVSRFCIEFIRRNPKIFWGFSEAQIFSLIVFVIGLLVLVTRK